MQEIASVVSYKSNSNYFERARLGRRGRSAPQPQGRDRQGQRDRRPSPRHEPLPGPPPAARPCPCPRPRPARGHRRARAPDTPPPLERFSAHPRPRPRPARFSRGKSLCGRLGAGRPGAKSLGLRERIGLEGVEGGRDVGRAGAGAGARGGAGGGGGGGGALGLGGGRGRPGAPPGRVRGPAPGRVPAERLLRLEPQGPQGAALQGGGSPLCGRAGRRQEAAAVRI